jgi:hypothetical protein
MAVEKKPSLLNRYIMRKTGAEAVVKGLQNKPVAKKRAIPAAPRLKPAPRSRERQMDEFRKYRD